MSRLTQVPASPCLRISRTGLSPAAAALSRSVPLSVRTALSAGPTTPGRRRHRPGLGSCAFARRYWRNHFCFLFLRVLRCFSSPGWRPASRGGTLQRAGLPHSDIRGSKGICPSPRLFAACRVLLRLREPRHPPCALLSFPFSFIRESRLS